MKLDSKYFDMIRIYRPPGADRETENGPCCQWKGCTRRARHRAPKGRGRDGEFFLFCAEHVRQYNDSYNYFDGMSDLEVAEYQKEAVYGHRPTWRVGVNAWSNGSRRPLSGADIGGFADARMAGARSFYARRAQQMREAAEYRRTLKPLERKALRALDLDDCSTRDEIKARFKALVKRHHPDANGGHTGSEEKLREIIQAYNYLKQAGLV
jgi:curved DNA-binding protein CbpA